MHHPISLYHLLMLLVFVYGILKGAKSMVKRSKFKANDTAEEHGAR